MNVTMPDGTVIQGVPDGTTKAQLTAKYAAHLGNASAQPTAMQTLAASPLGRFAHDTIAPQLERLGALAPLFLDFLPGGSHLADTLTAANSKASQTVENAYGSSVAAQRNRPGYADARAQADAQLVQKGSGLTDQVIAPLAPAMAGVAGGLFGGSLNASNAAADAQSAAQEDYAAKNPVSSRIAQFGGGFLAGPETAKLPVAPAAQTAPSIATLKAGAKAAYKQVDNSGVVISGQAYDNMLADLHAKLDKLGIDPDLHPDATAVMERLDDLQPQATAVGKVATPTADVPFQKMNTLRELAGDASGAQLPRDAMRGGVIQDHIDDFVDNLQPSDLSGASAVSDPAGTVAALNNARDLYSRAKQAETIQSVIDKSGIRATANYSQSGVENSLRQGFKSLALNDRAMARLSPDVQAAVLQVAKGGPISNTLRQIGKFAPHGVVSTAAGIGTGMALGGAEGGMIGALALPAIGEGARAGATALTNAAAQRALNTAALGRSAIKPLVVPPLQLPQLTPRSVAPFGLFGSGFGQQQPQYQ